VKSAVLVLGLATLAACSSGGATANHIVVADDSQRGQSMNHFAYTGHWEHLSGRNDGRFEGTSSRSRYAGDSAIFTFIGSVVRIYGVRGPNGGDAGIGIDGRYYGTASFYAPKKEPHALVFVSPPLTPAPHVVGLVVKGDAGNSHHAYVNIDGAEVLPQQ
jgi:hypothetical protein